MEDETITLACCGCIYQLTVYCTHCLRGNTVKDFYDNGEVPLPTGENDTTPNDNFTSELEQWGRRIQMNITTNYVKPTL